MLAPNNKKTVRQTEKRDIEQILKINTENNLGKWTAEDYENELNRQRVSLFTAEFDEVMAGYIHVRLITAEMPEVFGGSLNITKPAEADIINIGVAEKYKRTGIGQMLLQAFLKEARKLRVGSIWLEVRESNSDAALFYETNGFTKIQKRKNFYNAPLEDAVIMRLTL